MGLSLQDQLLKAGLADKKQAKKAKHEKRVKQKKNKGKNVTSPPEVNLVQQEKLSQAKRNQELNRQLNQEREKQEKNAQVRQLIEANRLDLRKYEAPYYFAVGKKVKKVYVNEEVTRKLSIGQLAIVTLDERFEIVPVQVARQISDRDQDTLIVLHTPDNSEN